MTTPPGTFNENPTRHSRVFYWKNLIGTCTASMLLSIPYNGSLYLLSSLYTEDGLGTLTLSVIFSVQSIVSIFLPPVFIKKMGYKGSMHLASGLIAVFVAANMIPSFATLMPGATIGAIGFSTLWTTANTIVCDIALEYASCTGEQAINTLSIFMGILHTALEASGIWTNLVTSVIIKTEDVDDILLPKDICGSNYCNEMENPSFMAKYVSKNKSLSGNSVAISTTELYELCLVYFLSVALAVVIIVTTVNFSNKDSNNTTEVKQVILSTLRMTLNRGILLLTVITSGAGFSVAFYVGDVTKAFVSCSVGIHYVGLTGTTYFVTCTVAAVLLGYIGRWTGNFSLMMVAALLTIALIVSMFFWSPSPNSAYILPIFSSIEGLTLAIFVTQLSVAYGENFKEELEAAYSHQRLMQSVGLAFGFATSHLLCFKTKMIIVIVWMLIGSYINVVKPFPLPVCEMVFVLLWRATDDTERSGWTLIGIISWGIGCARPGSPAGYTKVYYFMKWIKEQIGKDTKCPL